MDRPTRESLLEELRGLADKLGPDVTLYTFRQQTGIAPYYIYSRWGNWTNLRRAAGLPVRAHPGPVYSDDELLGEYHRAAVAVDDYPTHAEFNRLSDRCFQTLETRFGKTEDVRHQYRDWLAAHCPGEPPKFLEGCPAGFEPTVVPGLHIIDESWFRRVAIGLGVLLLAVFADLSALALDLSNTLTCTGDQTMPLLPPQAIVEHPADLVIDVFGTFLGKRSERMVVRWREGNDRPEEAESTRNGGPTVVQFPGPTPALADASAGGVPSATASTVETPTEKSPADRAAQGLLDLWDDGTCAATIRLSPAARLREKLDQIADDAGDGNAATEWRERMVPMSRLRSVTVSGRGVTISSDLIASLIERGIALSFLTRRGTPVAHLSAPGLGGTVQTRRSQLAAYDSALGVQLAATFVRGKLRNQQHQLQSLHQTAQQRGH
jgi:hypothetical protein